MLPLSDSDNQANSGISQSVETFEAVVLSTSRVEGTGSVGLLSNRQWGPLYFRDGKMYLPKAVALALIGSVTPEEISRSDLLAEVEEPSKRRILIALIRSLPTENRIASFQEGPPPPGAAPFIGPLPVDSLLKASRTLDATDAQLLKAVGGENAWLKTWPEASALDWLPHLGPGARRLVSRFADPERVGEEVRASKDKRETLEELNRLFFLGVLRRVAAPKSESSSRDSDSSADRLVPKETLHSLLIRIRENLAEVPIGVDIEQHRNEVVGMIAESGGSTHYELLGIEVDTPPDEVIAPYRQLARLVHPDHSTNLNLQGGEVALRLLFERATLAYLILSDVDRRKEYDLEQDLGGSVEIRSEEEIAESRKSIARKSFKEARRQLAHEDFHYAHEYSQIAVKNDPQPEYWALLGEVQSHNPKWLGNAAASLLKAVELKPKEPIFLYQLATIYEKQGNEQAATKAFEGVLEVMSNHPGAIEGLERLGARRASSDQGPLSWVRGLFSGS